MRHQKLEFSGPQDLVDLVHQLQGRVRPERQLDDVAAKVQLMSVDRDASEFSTIPPDTWTLAFGWFMHPIFEMRYGFPFHPNLLPLFVSFHCSKRELLTEEAIDYLRQYAPIGCRDWTTVDVLLSVDVPAFFSGCMTTTVNTVFPDTPAKPGRDAEVAYVDVPPADVPEGAPTYKHSDDAIRFRSFAANMYDAIELLETYRRRHSGLVTSRLHCYLPGRSIGVPVDFQPGNRSDPRFAGLIDISDAEFDRMRSAITSKLRTVMTAVMAGDSPDSRLRAVARPQCAGRRGCPTAPRGARTDVGSEGEPGRGGGPRAEHPTGRVRRRRCRAGRGARAARAASRRSRWCSPRQPSSAAVACRSGWSPATPIASTRPLCAPPPATRRSPWWAPGDWVTTCGRVDGTKPAPRDIDLLALSHLLPDVRRVVVIPGDSLVLGDLAELADLDLAGSLLAAPTVVGARGASGFGLLHAAGSRLRSRTAASAELRRQGHARHRFDFDAFEIGVLVLDLDEARRRSLLETYVSYVEEFGLSFREILLLEVGPHRVVLPERWHVVPNRSAETEPRLLHWAEAGKPWSDDVVDREELWHEAASKLRSRSASA